MDLIDKMNHINDMPLDYLAEFIISTLFDTSEVQHDFVISSDGSLKRKWSNDILYSEIIEYENGEEALNVHLSRDGIYDALPEALFHRPAEDGNWSGKKMAKESAKLKNEEKEIRSFFKPFEDEIFLQNTQLASVENKIFYDLLSDLINGVNPGFWKIDQKIPSHYATKLIKLLPFVHQIIGNFNLTEQALKFVINEEVKINYVGIEPEQKEVADKLPEGRLGECSLGYDLMLGQKSFGFFGILEFQIGPLNNSNPNDYLPNGPIERLLECFYGYFKPIEFETKTKLFLTEENRMFELSDNPEHVNSYLGYYTVLQ